jgi:hypothetical protein
MNEVLKKLRFDDSKKMLIINAPKSFEELITELKFDREPSGSDKGMYEYVQIFAITQFELDNTLKSTAKYCKYDCLFWACYPKGGGKIKSDIKRDTLWKALELVGMRPVTQIAIDETWSAMRARPIEMVGK